MPVDPKSEPTQEEIAYECELIREGWTEDERLRRLRFDWRASPEIRVEVPVVAIGILDAGNIAEE